MKTEQAVNTGYTPRHTGKPGKSGRSSKGGQRFPAVIIGVTALALLGVVIGVASVHDPSSAILQCRSGTVPAAGGCGTPSGKPRSTSTNTGISVYSGAAYGFSEPTAVAASRGHVWVTNVRGDSVTEMTGDGKPAAVLSAGDYGFRGPNAIAIGGGHLWVANVPANSITEMNAVTGAWERTLAAGDDLSSPYAIDLAGKQLWVANAASNSVTEINTRTQTWWP